MTIDAKSLSITSGSNLLAGININSGSAEAQAGDIRIDLIEDILIDGSGANPQSTIDIANSIFEDGNGKGGDITINSRNINFKNGGKIFIFNNGQGSLGNITLKATENITFDGVRGFNRSGVSNFIPENGTGNISNINITAQNLTLTNGAVVVVYFPQEQEKLVV